MFTKLSSVVVAAILAFSSSAYCQEEKQLLSDAMSSFSAISVDTPTKERIALYERGLSKVYRIIDEFGATDTGLALKSTGKYGEFNFSEIRKNYLNEISGFYNKTCQVTPSIICQAFAAYSDGVSRCKKAVDFRDLVEAHMSLETAMRIFHNEEKNIPLYNESKNEYFKCKKNASDVLDSEEYFKYKIADLFYDLNEFSAGKAFIEQIKTPHYKFLLVLKNYEKQNDPMTTERSSRLQKFIQETVDKNQLESDIMKLALLNSILAPGSKAEFNGGNFFRFLSKHQQKACHADSELTFERAHSVLNNYYSNVKQGRIKGGVETFYSDFSQDLYAFSWIDNCNQLYTLALSGEAYLIRMNKIKEAKIFIDNFRNGNYSSSKLKIIESWLDLATLPSDKKLPRMPSQMESGVDAHFAIYKKMLDLGLYCEASDLAKKSLRNSQYSNEALKILAKSFSSSGAKKSSCGDEDLEMLLK